jgi:hypothetical protein
VAVNARAVGLDRPVPGPVEVSPVSGGVVQQIAARKLYEKNGYCEIERQRLSGFDVIFFEKRL